MRMGNSGSPKNAGGIDAGKDNSRQCAFTASESRCIMHWFRRDLRIHDNIALNHALQQSKRTGLSLMPVFVFDPQIYSTQVCALVRATFARETVQALSKQLEKHCLTLRVSCGDSRKVIPLLANAVGASLVTFEKELDEYSRKRDQHVVSELQRLKINVAEFHGFTLYDPTKLLALSEGRAPTSMSSFLNLVSRAPKPNRAIDLSDSFADVTNAECPTTVEDVHISTDVPKLSELGYDEEQNKDEISGGPKNVFHFDGGEEAALLRMKQFIARDKGRAVRSFAKPDTSPAALNPRSTTLLSAYLAIGALSARTFWHAIDAVNSGDESVSQTSLKGQLWWREHFWTLALTEPNFERMHGNPLCRQIAWKDVDGDDDAKDALKRWHEAKTGYPWIDALMVQLRTEGFVHHLGRHSLACFLTRGDLWVSWEEGAKIFRKYLIDHDHALNAGNWMWLSASAFFNRYFRVYSPVAFARKWDKNGEFVRHYLPIVRKLPDKYVHEPWNAPLDVQKRAGCVVGKDYPHRIVIHEDASKENVQTMKGQFAKKEYGSPDRDSRKLSDEHPPKRIKR